MGIVSPTARSSDNFIIAGLDTEPLELNGVETIAAHEQVRLDIAKLAGQIGTLARLGWQNLDTVTSNQGDIFVRI